ASPGGPGDEEGLLPALVAQRMQPALEIGEREVGGFHRREPAGPVARRGPEHRDACLRLDSEGTVENVGERAEVDAVLSHEGGAVTHRNARVAPAESLGLQLPTERPLEDIRGEADPVSANDGVDGQGPAVVDEGQGPGSHLPPLDAKYTCRCNTACRGRQV